jgi:hypothetical protein
MRSLVGRSALVLTLCLVAVGVSHSVYGQAKSKVPSPPPKRESAKVGMIEVYKAKDGFRFRTKDTDGKTVAIAATPSLGE